MKAKPGRSKGSKSKTDKYVSRRLAEMPAAEARRRSFLSVSGAFRAEQKYEAAKLLTEAGQREAEEKEREAAAQEQRDREEAKADIARRQARLAAPPAHPPGWTYARCPSCCSDVGCNCNPTQHPRRGWHLRNEPDISNPANRSPK